MTVILTPAQIQDDLAFWLNQDKEHNLFFMNGFLDSALKSAAAKLFLEYDKALSKGNLEEALESIVPRSQAFKLHALERMKGAPPPPPPPELRARLSPRSRLPASRGDSARLAGPPGGAGALGYIWPSFVEHTGREVDTMLARIRGELRSRDEICMGDRMLAEHAAFAAHLLDPAERALVSTAQEASDKTFDLVANCTKDSLETLIMLSRTAGTALDAFVKGPLSTAKSVIHPLLADHVKREGERFLGTLAVLPNDETGQPAQPPAQPGTGRRYR